MSEQQDKERVELERCPRCGGNAGLYSVVDTSMSPDPTNDWPDFYVSCHNGCLQTRRSKNQRVVLDHWNERDNSPILAAEKALRERIAVRVENECDRLPNTDSEHCVFCQIASELRSEDK